MSSPPVVCPGETNCLETRSIWCAQLAASFRQDFAPGSGGLENSQGRRKQKELPRKYAGTVMYVAHIQFPPSRGTVSAPCFGFRCLLCPVFLPRSTPVVCRFRGPWSPHRAPQAVTPRALFTTMPSTAALLTIYGKEQPSVESQYSQTSTDVFENPQHLPLTSCQSFDRYPTVGH
jgi:hypothetical protein